MNHLDLPLPEILSAGGLDVLSTVVLMWGATAVLVRMKRVPVPFLALSITVAATVTIDGLFPAREFWNRSSVAVAGVIHVAVIQGLRLRPGRKRKTSDGSALGKAVFVTGWVVLAISAAGVVYSHLRDRPEAFGFFARFSFGFLLAALFFGLLCRFFPARHRRSAAVLLAIAFAGTLIFRTGAWAHAWRNPGSPVAGWFAEAAPGASFPRLAALLEIRRALGVASTDRATAVEHLHRAERSGARAWWADQLPSWTEQSIEFPLALAFGTSVSLEPGEEAVALCLDETGSRFLVATDRGRVVSSVDAAGTIARVEFPPVDACVSVAGDLLVLGPDGTLARFQPMGGFESDRLPGGPFRGIACSAYSLYAVRADGSIIRSGPGEGEEVSDAVWPGADEAVDIAATSFDGGVYVLGAHGGLSPRGNCPIKEEDLAGHEKTVHYWPQWRVAVAIAATMDGFPVYADQYGGVHAVVRSGEVVRHTGYRFPLLREPIVVDMTLGEPYSAVYLLTRAGRILVVPEHGWMGTPSRYAGR